MNEFVVVTALTTNPAPTDNVTFSGTSKLEVVTFERYNKFPTGQDRYPLMLLLLMAADKTPTRSLIEVLPPTAAVTLTTPVVSAEVATAVLSFLNVNVVELGTVATATFVALAPVLVHPTIVTLLPTARLCAVAVTIVTIFVVMPVVAVATTGPPTRMMFDPGIDTIPPVSTVVMVVVKVLVNIKDVVVGTLATIAPVTLNWVFVQPIMLTLEPTTRLCAVAVLMVAAVVLDE